ncbi:MAG: hypothetical protein CVV49_21875 [Spirochaetae bacterium HGW-Spirochaetae-5]|nr:MAG: hypothetical protein CVV49_21875 [Spirochaetae bacterium HGW-Spirochaetae-5]
MRNSVIIDFKSREELHSEYDWANITYHDDRVGKARCKIDGETLTIFTINIFPEFAGQGIGRIFVEEAKVSFNTIIADRVRHKAIGFWEKSGFCNNSDGSWIYVNEAEV